MPEFRLKELADRIGCRLDGDGSIMITGVNTIEAAGPGELTFVHNEKYVSAIPDTRASAIVISDDIETDFRPLLRSTDPYVSFGELMRLFLPRRERPEGGIHPTATVSSDALVDPSASIGPYCTIAEGVVIGPEATVLAGSFVGEHSSIGARVWIYPNTVIGSRTRMGDDVVIHSGTVFLTAAPIENSTAQTDTDNNLPKFLIEVGRDVEIGANCIIECGQRTPTRIGPGTKIDNLVRIGAEAKLGDDCIIVAQVSIGRGATIGNNVTLAGQVAVESHRQIGDEAMVGAKSLVFDEVEGRAVVSGIPAIRHDLDLRLRAHLRRLPKLFQRVEALEQNFRTDTASSD